MYLKLAVIAINFITCVCLCPDLNGNKVAWWILYQQKDTPFSHVYVDSTSTQDPLIHYPDKEDSVLSRTILSITDRWSEYIVYSSDLVNAQNVAKQLQFPTYSKWMHGIIGTNNNWASGLWLLHNNLFFPPIKSNKLVKPGSNAWKLSTMGDSEADIFYICITAGDRAELDSIIQNVMVSNPFIVAKYFNRESFVQAYFKNMKQANSFQFEAAFIFAQNCMYADPSNVTRHCLFKHVLDSKITILARPRGLIYHQQTFCYTGQGRSMTALVGLERSSGLKYEVTDSIFQLTQARKYEMEETTCFGQDIATNTQYVAVTICVHQQNLFKDLIKSVQYSNWACPEGITPPQKSVTRESGFCTDNECARRDQRIQSTGTRWIKNPLQKNFKLSEQYMRMKLEMALPNITDPKVKTFAEFKQRVPHKIVRTLDSTNDITNYIVENENAVLGLFCQEGCRFCQIAKEKMIMLNRIFQLGSIDIVIVNIRHPAVPQYLSVPWTPYLRFKSQGSSSKWTDSPKNQKYDMTSIFNFLHEAVIKARYVRESVDVTHDVRKNVDGMKDDGSQEQDRSTRVKRGVQQSFIKKHIWEHSQIDSIRLQDATSQFERVKSDKKLIPDNKIGRRRSHSFIVTTNLSRTQTELDSIATNMYLLLPNNEKPGNVLLKDAINIASFNKSVSLVQLTLKPSTTREGLVVIECVFALQGSFKVGGSVRRTGFNLGHFDEIILDINAKTPCLDVDTPEPDNTCNVDT